MTGRLINADALKEALNKSIVEAIQHGNNFSDAFKNDSQEWSAEIWTIEDKIDNAPTVDAEPVRHGKWIPCMTDSRGCTDMFKCSECKRYSYYAYGVKQLDYKYCPHCGAKMDGGENDKTD